MEIATKKDLEDFKNEIIQAINGPQKEELDLIKENFIKSKEASELLGCSYGTLHNLKPILNPQKLGGTLYWDKNLILEYLSRKAS